MTTTKNLYVDQSASFIEFIDVVDTAGNPVNLLNYTVDAWFAKEYGQATSYAFVVELVTPSKIKLYLDATTTNQLKAGRYVYDVIVKNSCDEIDRIQQGIIVVSPGVTKCQ